MTTTLRVLLALLVVASAAAAWSWTQTRVLLVGQGKTVVELSRERIETIEFRGASLRATLRPARDALGPHVWAVFERDSAQGLQRARFQGGRPLRRVVDGFARIEAQRILGPDQYRDLGEFGLATPLARVLVHHDDPTRSPLEFDIGERAANGFERYIQPAGGSEVWLVNEFLVKPFFAVRDGAELQTVAELQLVGVMVGDVAELELGRGASAMMWRQAHREDVDARKWVDAVHGEVCTGLQAALERLSAVRAQRYWPDNQGEPELREQASWRLVLADGRSIEGQIFSDAAAPAQPRWFARSSHTRTLVELEPEAAAAVVADFRTVRGACVAASGSD